MSRFSRGEVWVVDLGMAAKIRPALVLSIAPADTDRALITIVPHTTSVRGSSVEVAVNSAFLKPGAFDAQNLVTIPQVKLVRRLGELSTDDMQRVEQAVRRWLGL